MSGMQMLAAIDELLSDEGLGIECYFTFEDGTIIRVELDDRHIVASVKHKG